jgi:hypothetical protein
VSTGRFRIGWLRLARRIAQAAAITILAAGAVMIALAIAGPWLGLGREEHSLFFRWFGLSRFDLAADGGVVLIVGAFLATLVLVPNPGVLLCNTLVPLLVAELLARTIDGKPLLAMRNWFAERNAMFTATIENVHDPILGWIPKPNLKLNPQDSARSINTGPYGIRGNRPEAGNAAAPPTGTILAVGDSFTFGTEVGDRFTWPAYLEGMIGRPVLNAGVPGYGTDQIVLRAESLIPVLKPAKLIVSFFQADFERAALKVFSGANKPYFTVENESLVLHNVPVPPYTGRLRETPLWLVPLSYSYLVQFAMDRLGWAAWWQYLRSAVGAGNDPEAVSCALLRRLRQELASRGPDLLLVLQYAGARSASKPSKPRSMAACAREIGVDTLDLWDDLVSLRDRSFEEYGRLYEPSDGKTFRHMSPEGNLFVAERVAAKLRARTFDPPNAQ